MNFDYESFVLMGPHTNSKRKKTAIFSNFLFVDNVICLLFIFSIISVNEYIIRPVNVVHAFFISILQLIFSHYHIYIYIYIFFHCRLIGVEEYLCWDSVIVSHMQEIRPRSTMIWQWSIWPMCFCSLLLAHLFIHSCMNNIRAGILGFFPHLQAVSTCLVSHF